MKREVLASQITAKAEELGLWEEALTCALFIISQNRELMNALDNRTELDEYIYRSLIKDSTDKRRQKAQANLRSKEESIRLEAEKELMVLSRDELMTDPYFRAVLPIIVKIVDGGPVLRLHAEEASDVVFKLADFKRMHRTTSLTSIIVTRCNALLESFSKELVADSPEVQ